MTAVGQSWGLYPRAKQTCVPLTWADQGLPRPNGTKILPFGMGRSYGDSCLNDGGILLVTPALRRFISFDDQTGLLRCEAGVTLEEILRVFVPRGWFLPTTPGTKFVTVGGAIANDVHGKNHHRAGTFGCHVTRFELLRSNGDRLICSPQENPELFRATIGGLGLTGLITWAEFKLRPIKSDMIEMESLTFGSIDEFLELSTQSDQNFEYTVSWLDCLAAGTKQGRGVFMRGNHSESGEPSRSRPSRTVNVPFVFPGFVLNPLSMKAFNSLYYWKNAGMKRTRVHYDPFFYPLDAIGNWNRVYGANGFFQYQFVVPVSEKAAVGEILTEVAASGRGTFLAVLKTFGSIKSPGLMSFPRPGVTLCLDFPNRGKPTMELFEKMDAIVTRAGGRIYPAKDARMSADVFRVGFPEWQEFVQYIDPQFSSSFWRRVTS